MRRIGFILALLLAFRLPDASAKELLAYRDSVQQGYNFLFYVPDGYRESEDAYPLIVFLHGKSLTGSNLNMVTRYGCVDALRRGVSIDALVLCPQSNVVGWDARRVMDTIDYVTERYRVDRNRIYLYGMSMGGWGVFKVLAAYPDRIAAGIAMCGGYTGMVEPLTETPLWIIHGTNDDVTSFSYSSGLVKKMVATGKADRLYYTWLTGCDHSILARAYLLPDTYKWLLEHRLNTPRRPCCRDYDISPTDLDRAYLGLHSPRLSDLPITIPQ